MITDICQRWTEGRESRRPAGELIKVAAFDVAPIELDAEARTFVSTHHYAKDASPTPHRFGLYKRGVLSGVALFGPPASMNAHRAVFPTLAIDEAVTLGRLVLLEDVEGNGESWFIARCFELLAELGAIAVESCADPQPRTMINGDKIHRGHLGIIYQATNGRYVGKTDPNTIHLLPDGTCLSKRTQQKIRSGERGATKAIAKLVGFGADPLHDGEDATAWLRRAKAAVTRPMRHYGNHRYLWCLNKRRRREVLTAEALPYPKFDSHSRLTAQGPA